MKKKKVEKCGCSTLSNALSVSKVFCPKHQREEDIHQGYLEGWNDHKQHVRQALGLEEE